MPSAEIFESLSRGIIDAAIYSVGGLKSHGLADVASNVVMLNLGAFRSGSLFSFNADTWSAFTPEQRAAIYRAAASAAVLTVNAYREADDEALELAKEKKLPVEQPDESPGRASKRLAFVRSSRLLCTPGGTTL